MCGRIKFDLQPAGGHRRQRRSREGHPMMMIDGGMAATVQALPPAGLARVERVSI
jgi:hypothetical protein